MVYNIMFYFILSKLDHEINDQNGGKSKSFEVFPNAFWCQSLVFWFKPLLTGLSEAGQKCPITNMLKEYSRLFYIDYQLVVCC